MTDERPRRGDDPADPDLTGNDAIGDDTAAETTADENTAGEATAGENSVDDGMTDENNSDESTADASGDGRARRAGVIALRVARGTVGVWVAIAVILIVGLVPLPTVAITAPAVEVVPVQVDQLRLCAGAALRLGDVTGQDAGTAAPLGVPSVRSGVTGGQVSESVLASSDAGTGGTAAAPALFRLAPAESAALAAAQSQVVDAEGFTGLAATGCAEPNASIWLVGGATTVGRTTLLTIGNPSEVDATVAITIFSEEGVVRAPGMAGIHVAAGSQRVLSLAGYAPDLASPIVHVESRGGRVAAWLQQTVTRVLDPGGVDLIGESTEPALSQVVPGVRILDAIGVSRTLGRQDYADLVPVVRLGVPGDDDATVTVNVIPDDPSLTGTSFEIEVAGGTVADIPLDAGAHTESSEVGLADGMYTVRVEADRPVLAAVRVSTAEEPSVPVAQASPFVPPAAPETDFAWLPSAPELTAGTMVAVPPGSNPRFTVVNPESSEIEVLLVAQGGADVSIVVPANGTATVDVEPGTSYLIDGPEGLRASVTFAAVGRLAGFSVVSPLPGSRPIVIRP
jgi:hypothetical protein